MIYITTPLGIQYQYCPERKELDIIDRVNIGHLAVVYLKKEDLIELKTLINRMELD
jgi:hypothetical protein